MTYPIVENIHYYLFSPMIQLVSGKLIIEKIVGEDIAFINGGNFGS